MTIASMSKVPPNGALRSRRRSPRRPGAATASSPPGVTSVRLRERPLARKFRDDLELPELAGWRESQACVELS